VHPLDVIRVNMQVDAGLYRNSLHCATTLVKAGGVVNGLYAGISAGIFRQILYGMPRMAMYSMLLEKYKPPPGEQLPFVQKLALGLAAGGTASFFGTPSEVCLVRMSADQRAPEHLRRNYKHVVDALITIGKEEGVAALWKGAGPTVARACLLNAGQLGVYSEAKQVIQSKSSLTGIPLMICSGLISGTAAVGMSCPADVRCAFSDRSLHSRSGIVFRTFAPLQVKRAGM
jgi:solute carrier family 25 oxoglutarate transporter 11